MLTQTRQFFTLSVVILFGCALAGLLLAGAGQQAALAAPSAATLYVDGDGVCGETITYTPCYTHPQLAVDAAAPGDVIKIASSTYYSQTFIRGGHEQILYISKTLTLIGGYEPSFAEPPSDMTAINLIPPPGARAIYIDNNAVVSLRYFYFYGADGPTGSAVYADHANLTLQGVRFNQNHSPACALWFHDGRLRFEDGSFYLNQSTDGGASLCATQALTGSLVSKVTFASGIGAWGSAVALTDSLVTIERSYFQENSALTGTAGAILVDGGTYTLTNNVFIRNYAPNGPTVIGVKNAWLNFVHNTINGDYYNQELIGVSAGGGLLLRNNILANADAGVDLASGSALTGDTNLFYNIFTPTQSGALPITMTTVYTADPGFGASPTQFWIDHHSFAEGKAAPTGIAIDYDGAFRPIGSGPDLGAIEAPLPYAVDSDLSMSPVFSDPGGLTTTVFIPAGATSLDWTLLYTPIDDPGRGFTQTLDYGGRAFDISPGAAAPVTMDHATFLPLVQRGSVPVRMAVAQPLAHPQAFPFLQPIVLTLQYLDADVAGMDESDLRLYYYDEDAKKWADIVSTCTGASYTRDLANNLLTVPVCHLSRFAVGGGKR